MDLVKRLSGFKRAHIHHYWARLVLFWVILALAFTAVEVRADAPAASGVTAHELISDGFEGGLSGPHMGPAGGRQSNGTLWHFGTQAVTFGTDHEFWASYSSNNGTDWSSFLVLDNSDPGFGAGGTPWMVTDCVMLSNNSVIVVVVLKNYDTTSNYECWLLAHWNNSDLAQWEKIDIYSVNGQSIDRDPTAAVNDTDVVMVCYENDGLNRVYHDLFTPSTRGIVIDYDTHEPQASYGPWALCNSTGVFFIGVMTDADDDLDVFTTAWGLVFTQAFSSNYFPMDVVVTGDDTFVTIAAQAAGGVLTLYYWNETATDYRDIVDLATGDTTVEYPSIELQNDTDTWIRICGYSNDDDGFKFAGAHYYSDAEYWQLTWGTTAWDETDDSQKTYLTFMPHDLFPMTTDPVTSVENRTNLPNAGALCYITDYDIGEDEDDLWEFHVNETVWPGAPYYHYDPFYEPPVVPPGDEDEDEAICSSSWMVFAVLALMLFVMIGWTANNVM